MLPISAAAYLARADRRTVARLCSDSLESPVDPSVPGQVEGNANLEKARKGASGEVSGRLVASGRWTAAELNGLEGDALEALYDLVAAHVTIRLFHRRPDQLPGDFPRQVTAARWELEMYASGEKTF